MAILSDYNYNGLQVQTYTEAKLLAANVPEFIQVPTDQNGKLAKFVKFGKGAAADFYARVFSADDGSERAINGNMTSTITNGAFATDTGWTKGEGWAIAAGVASATTASTALSQTSATTLVEGRSYTIQFEISSWSAGTVTVSVGGTDGTARGADGTFTETIVAGDTQVIALTGDGFTGAIDNVRMIAWELGTDWSIGDGVATASNTADGDLSQDASPTVPLVEGQKYLVTFTATASAGSIAVSLGGGTAGTSRSSSATFSEVITAGATQEILFASTGFTGTIDDVSILPAIGVPGDDDTGLVGEQNPEGFFLNGTVDKIAVVSAGTPIITASFYK